MHDEIQAEKLIVFTHEKQAPYRYQYASKRKEWIHFARLYQRIAILGTKPTDGLHAIDGAVEHGFWSSLYSPTATKLDGLCPWHYLPAKIRARDAARTRVNG